MRKMLARIQSFTLLLCLSVAPFLVEAQNDTLTLDDYKSILLSHHPIAKKANLFDYIAESYLLQGDGVLDPKLVSNFDTKQFKDQNYFRTWNSEIKVPTRLPVDFSVGYERNAGTFLNEQNFLPDNGLLYGSLNVSLLRGLMFDQQRFDIQKSEIFADKSEIEKQIIIRELVFQGLNIYLEWAAAYLQLQNIEDYLSRVNERHIFIKQLFENGDKPAIDTVESRINLNTATKDRISAQDKYFQVIQKLNLFLWSEDGEPLVLQDQVVPEDFDTLLEELTALIQVIDLSFQNDPLVKKTDIQIRQIALENRLAKEQLKPQLDLKLNTIHSLGENDLAYSYSPNDYKLGAKLELPLRNRKARAQIRLNEAIIDQVGYDQEYKIYELQNKYLTLLNSQILQAEAIVITNEKVENSQLLYDAERLKFELGESSVFLLNDRERKLLDARFDNIKSLKELTLIINQLYFLNLGQL